MIARCATSLLIILIVLPVPSLVTSAISTGVDAETGLKYWDWQADGVQFRLTQRLPDQTRAFFLARGFSAKDAETIALSCVFQSMFKNTGDVPGDIEISMHDWRIIASGSKTFAPLTREHWSQVWDKRRVSKPARIAFEWSLLPSRQTYSSGDYNWGMSSYGLPPGSQFSLQFGWRHNGESRTGRIDGIECPPDIHPEPQQ